MVSEDLNSLTVGLAILHVQELEKVMDFLHTMLECSGPYQATDPDVDSAMNMVAEGLTDMVAYRKQVTDRLAMLLKVRGRMTKELYDLYVAGGVSPEQVLKMYWSMVGSDLVSDLFSSSACIEESNVN